MVSKQFCGGMSVLYNVQYVLLLPEIKLILPCLSFLAFSAFQICRLQYVVGKKERH